MINKSAAYLLSAVLSFSAAHACLADAAKVAEFGSYENEHFMRQTTVKDCVLIETKLEKQTEGAPVLRQQTRMPLNGAALFDVRATKRPKGAASPTSRIIDFTDHTTKPMASLFVSAPKKQQGTVETLQDEQETKAGERKRHMNRSARLGPGIYAMNKTSQLLIIRRGRDVLPRLRKLEDAIRVAIATCTS